MRLSVECLEAAITRLHNLRAAQIIAENPAVASLVAEETRDADYLLKNINGLLRERITLDLIFDKIVNPGN